jgi:hypothetical protein
MMTMSRITNYVAAEPFKPFRVRMASGEHYDIRHPEMIQVGKTTATIFTWMDQSSEAPRERQQEVSILLIEAIELLNGASMREESTK